MQLSIGAALAALLLPLCVACSETDSAGEEGNGVSINIKVLASYGYDGEGYETGTGYENYIDVTGGDYRIYFFTTDNTFIARFITGSAVSVEGSGYTEYSLYGRVPDELLDYKSFKMVMLANWGTYKDTSFDQNTTIDDVCNAEWATYTHLEDFDHPERLIPFYGMNTYTDVTYKADNVTMLDSPITLLRAMAKVEVVLKDDEYPSFEYVLLHRYNREGCCAPSGVYQRSDYDSGYTVWDTDFWNTVHLVGDSNDRVDNKPEEKTLDFLKTQEYAAGGEDYETWTAYVPEYSNTSAQDDYSYIEVRLNGISYNIYFGNYENGDTNSYDDGNTDYTDRYDIHRNNLYRFTVSTGNQTLNVHVDKWDTEYYNNYTFGAGTEGNGDD